MKGKMQRRLLSLLLSVTLAITGLEMPTVLATEESVQAEQSTFEQTSEKTQPSETDSNESEIESTPSPEETTTESEETSDKLQTDTETDSSESMSESQSEEETTTQQTESNSSEQQTEEKPSESEQESEILTEELNSETTETITEEITESTTEITTEEETTEITTKELQSSDLLEWQYEVVVNPLYEGIIDPDELAQQLNSLQIKSQNSAKNTAQSFQTFDAAVDYLKNQMVKRESTVSIEVPLSVSEENKGDDGFPKTLLYSAVAHTEECTGQEGDALKWQYGGSKMSMSSTSSTYTVTYTISYYTTLAQEQELTTKVNEALDSLALSGKTDYQKVKAIHDYICDNTDYDYENLENDAHKIKFTAYGALCTGKAVCQGYAVAFYRMCKEAGLPVRIITGIGNGGPHAWNIVKIGNNARTSGKYYNIDCTWDGQDQQTYHKYFLLNEKDFEDHTRDEEYNTSAFHAQYPMSETSYVDESTLPTGLNKENPSATFTTIDDKTVRSDADGKPKLLIFFRTTCPNSQSTIRAIAGHEFTGLDILAADIDGRSKDDIINFKNTYGSDAITFSYGTYGVNNTSLFYYMQAAGLTNGNQYSATLPVLCYIDANNMLQHVTQGVQNASQIEVNLKNYCSAAPVKQYKITYALNGGTNHSDNPTTFKENSDTIILKDPTKDGATFAGWYLDAAFTQKVTQIERGTASDITLYAKWSSSGATDKLNVDNPECELITIDGEYVYTTVENKPKILIFFSVNCGNSINTIRGIAQQGLPGVDIFAIDYIQSSKESVTNFKNQYGNDSITFIWDNLLGNLHAMRAYNDAANHEDITPPMICYVDANNKLQHITNGYRSASAIKADLDAYCSGTSTDPSPSDTYTITYELDGGTNHGNNPATYTAATDTIILQAPTKEGYIFAGWYRDAAFTLPITQIEKGSSGNITLYAKWENGTQEPDGDKISISKAVITLSNETFFYNGKQQEPDVTVTYENKLLLLDSDYTINYKDNRNAGTATVTITGINNYQGFVSKNFTIQPAKLIITALDRTLLAGSRRPAPNGYDYQIEGLVDNDQLMIPPTFTCNVSDPVEVGTYSIIPGGARADSNYNANITYRNGTLEVVKEFTGYTVTFDTQGHGTAPQAYSNIASGTAVKEPMSPSAQGYQFEGWYREPECKTAWNFGTDIVQSDLTLYAKWSIIINKSDFRIQEISDMYYTGKACKPSVSVYDGDTLLKLNKDYSLKYENNINVGSKIGNGIDSNYKAELPSIRITGKGNYQSQELCANFTIQKANIADENKNPAKGVTLKYTDQLVTNPSRAINPFGSLKYGKALKKDTDFALSIKPVKAFDKNGKPVQNLSDIQIPAGYYGTFQLIISGKGNYEGTIEKNIYVSDKSKLLKNAKITLGANLKSIKFSNANTEKEVVLHAGYKEGNTYYRVDKNGNISSQEVSAKDVFLVTCNGNSLIYKKDFDVDYTDNNKVGTASMTIIGKGEYIGEKTTTFRITGEAFKANTVTVEGIADKVYTGNPLTQDMKEIKLTYKSQEDKIPLNYRSDYTINYKKNISKGTATITFTAAEGSIYSGSFSKTFKITAANITSVLDANENNSVYDITAPYEKAGAKPAEQICLTYYGTPLQYGKDYTVSYKDNKAVTTKNGTKPPIMVIKGKGNFTGSKEIPFTITKATLTAKNITITPVAYNERKADSYQYTPSVKIKVGNSTLKKGVDYTLAYRHNDQVSYKAYIEKLEKGIATNNDQPVAIITSIPDSNYNIQEIEVPLPIYQTKITKNNVYIVVDEATYTGQQIKPAVQVYFADSEHTEALKKVKNEKLTDNSQILQTGLILLKKDDYTLSYGANITAGKNKGSVTIIGNSPNYGGSISQKFDIQKKIVK